MSRFCYYVDGDSNQRMPLEGAKSIIGAMRMAKEWVLECGPDSDDSDEVTVTVIDTETNEHETSIVRVSQE